MDTGCIGDSIATWIFAAEAAKNHVAIESPIQSVGRNIRSIDGALVIV
jgi:hypothetical protein